MQGASLIGANCGPCDFDEAAVDVGGLEGVSVFGRGGGVTVCAAPAVPPLAPALTAPAPGPVGGAVVAAGCCCAAALPAFELIGGWLEALRRDDREALQASHDPGVVRPGLLGDDHPDVDITLNNHAALLIEQGRYNEAEPLLRRALGTVERTLEPTHPSLGLCRANHAHVLAMAAMPPER